MKYAAYLLAPAVLLGVTPALAQNKAAPATAPAASTPATAPATTTPATAPAAVTPAATAPPTAPATPEPAAAAAAPEPAPAAPEPVAAAPSPAAAVAITAEPEAPKPAARRSSLELFGYLAPSVVQGEPANPALTNSFRRVGVYGEAGVAFRSKYFLDPFFSVGYGTLASGTTEIPDSQWGPGGTLHQHLGTWVISPGITADIWRFRLRLGIGLAVVLESNRFQGEKNSASQKPLVSQAGIGFNCYEAPHFRLDAEARYITAKGADVTFWALGVTGRGDLISF